MNDGKRRSNELTRQHLRQSSASLLSDDVEVGTLGYALKRLFPDLERAFVLNCVPEQGEDIYWVLIDPLKIAEIEIPRGAHTPVNPPMLKVITLEEYRQKKLTRDIRQKLEIGLEMMKIN